MKIGTDSWFLFLLAKQEPSAIKLLTAQPTVQLPFQTRLFLANKDRTLVLSNEGTLQDGACRKARNRQDSRTYSQIHESNAYTRQRDGNLWRVRFETKKQVDSSGKRIEGGGDEGDGWIDKKGG
jgi:hypothetical protein